MRSVARILTPLSSLLLLLTMVGPAQASVPIFRDPTVYYAGPDPQTVQVSDLNQDGKLDLVEVNQCCGTNQNTVGVLLGNGDGTFGTATFYNVGKMPTWVAIADFNSDGYPDLAVSNAGSTFGAASVSVLLGNGDGTFKTAVNYSAGTTCQFVAAADLNGDSKIDLAVANKGSNNVSVLIANGDGTFKAAVNYAAGTAPAALVLADLNNDGKLDLAVANNVTSPTSSVQALLGNGDGTFQAAKASTGAANTTAIASGDFDGDGKQDVVVNNSSGNSVSVLLGNGDGTFKTPRSVGVGLKPSGVAVGDLNNDHKLDIVAADDQLNLNSVALGNGDGTFQTHQDYVGGGLSVTLADLNGDGNLDTVSARPLGNRGTQSPAEVDVTLGVGNGTMPQDVYTAFSGALSLGAVAADNNHGGILDVIAPEFSANTVDVYQGNGDGTFQSPRKYAAGTGPRNPVLADFNRDGIQDVAVLNCHDFGAVVCSLAVLLGNADGSFQAPVITSSVGTGETLAINAGDLNGDGFADIVVPNFNNNTLDVFINRGDGTFQPGVSYAVNIPFRAVIADLNNDGKLDVAVTGFDSSGGAFVDIFLGNGDGTLLPPTMLSMPYEGVGIAAGDLNADGKVDLAVARALEVAIFLGNGDGTFTTGNAYTAPGYLQNLTVADVNGDGKADVVTANLYYIGTLLGNGDGTLQPYDWYRVAGYDTEVLAADFNGDGAADILYNYGGFGVVLNGGGVFIISSSTPNPSTLRQSVTLTANITPTFTGAPVPTGSVTFTDGTTTLGTASLSNGQAVLSTEFIKAGTHTIQPSYSGDSYYNPRTGASISQSVLSPTVNLNPTSLNFGNQKVGTTSNPQTVKLTNRGSGALLISSFTISGDYQQANNCPTSLARNTSCLISVTFTPTKTGIRPGSITIIDNATNSPQKVTLTGNGT